MDAPEPKLNCYTRYSAKKRGALLGIGIEQRGGVPPQCCHGCPSWSCEADPALMAVGMTIVGYAVLNANLIEEQIRAQLHQLGETTNGLYGALFVYDHAADGTTTKWTFFTADPDYAEMLTKGTGKEEFDPQVLRAKLPAYQPGWVISDRG